MAKDLSYRKNGADGSLIESVAMMSQLAMYNYKMMTSSYSHGIPDQK